MNTSSRAALRVRAGRGNACAGLWVRSRTSSRRLLLPTVAHVLFGADGRLREPMRVGSADAHLVASVPLSRRTRFSADAALLAVPDDAAEAFFFPSAGHLNRFCHGLRVMRVGAGGDTITGILVRAGWSGVLRYSFGPRDLIDQWVVDTDRQGRGSQRVAATAARYGPRRRVSRWGCRWAFCAMIRTSCFSRRSRPSARFSMSRQPRDRAGSPDSHRQHGPP